MYKLALFALYIACAIFPSELISQTIQTPKPPTAVADMSWSINALRSITQYQDRLTAGARVENCIHRNLCLHGGGFLALDNLLAVTPLNGNSYFLHGAVGIKPKFNLPVLGNLSGLPSVGVTRDKLPDQSVSYYGFVALGLMKEWGGSKVRLSLGYEQIVYLFNVNLPGSNGAGIRNIRTVAVMRGLDLGMGKPFENSRLDITIEGGHTRETPGEPKYGIWTANGTIRFGSTVAPCIMVGTRSVLSLSAPRMEAMKFVAGCISVRTKGF